MTGAYTPDIDGCNDKEPALQCGPARGNLLVQAEDPSSLKEALRGKEDELKFSAAPEEIREFSVEDGISLEHRPADGKLIGFRCVFNTKTDRGGGIVQYTFWGEGS